MTRAQLDKIRNKATLRVEPLMIAIQWLLENNTEWKRLSGNLNLAELREELEQTNAVLLDKDVNIEESTENAANNSNIEDSETFRVFFPDGTVNPENGGQGNVKDFKEMVKQAKDNGFDLEY